MDDLQAGSPVCLVRFRDPCFDKRHGEVQSGVKTPRNEASISVVPDVGDGGDRNADTELLRKMTIVPVRRKYAHHLPLISGIS